MVKRKLSAAEGQIYLYPKMTTKLVSDYLRRVESGEPAEDYGGLTAREREVLALIADGRSNSDVAGKIHVSPYTVQSHRENIMRKLNIHSRTELLKYAVKRGLIQLDS